MSNRKLLALVMGSLLSSYQVSAADISFSGDGSFRGGMLLDDKFTQEFFQYSDDKIDFEVEARWAYLNYQLSPVITVTSGRFALPYFRNSDTAENRL